MTYSNTPNQPSYIIGLDLGKKRDYTALVVLKQTFSYVGDTPTYDLIHLDRWRGKDYLDAIPIISAVRKKVLDLAGREYISRNTIIPGNWRPSIDLVIDQTGVGEGVIESLRAAGLDCYGILIHGGEKAASMPGGWRVPKRELVGTAEVLLQNKRLHFAKELKMADVLLNELQSFKATIKLSTGHVSYAADETWRDGEHDDTVLALCIAAWFGESHDPRGWDELDRYMDLQLGRA